MAKQIETTRSASPVQAMTEMDWPDAQRAVLDGKKLRRQSWSNPDLYMLMANGYLSHRTPSGELHRLVVCQEDLMATDWIVVREM